MSLIVNVRIRNFKNSNIIIATWYLLYIINFIAGTINYYHVYIWIFFLDHVSDGADLSTNVGHNTEEWSHG